MLLFCSQFVGSMSSAGCFPAWLFPKATGPHRCCCLTAQSLFFSFPFFLVHSQHSQFISIQFKCATPDSLWRVASGQKKYFAKTEALETIWWETLGSTPTLSNGQILQRITQLNISHDRILRHFRRRLNQLLCFTRRTWSSKWPLLQLKLND